MFKILDFNRKDGKIKMVIETDDSSSVLIHSGVFVVLGLALAIPFMGLIPSNLTPVALVYTLLMLHGGTSIGYWAVAALAIVFSSTNLWIMIVELQNKYEI